MDRIYYYIRNSNNFMRIRMNNTMQFSYRPSKGKPMITVCLLIESNGDMSRGISVCSCQDVVCKKTGKDYATLRALNALVNHTTTEAFDIGKRIRSFPNKSHDDIKYITAFLADYNPALTHYEKTLVDKLKPKQPTITLQRDSIAHSLTNAYD